MRKIDHVAQVRALQEKQQALELGERTKRLRLADERAAAEARLDAAGREALAQKAAVLQKLREVRRVTRVLPNCNIFCEICKT